MLLKYIKLLFVVCCLLSTGQILANQQQKVQLSHNTATELLSPYVSYYRQLDPELTIEQLLTPEYQNKFELLDKEQVNQGVTGDAFWLKINLQNVTHEDIEWVLLHETSYLDEMLVYVVTENAPVVRKKVSDFFIFDSRDESYRKLNVRHLSRKDEESTIYVRLQMIQVDTITLALSIYAHEQLDNLVADEQYFYGMYFGAGLSLIVISFIFWLKIRTPLQLSYFVYLIINTLFWSFLTGHIFQYVLFDNPSWYNKGFHIVYLLFYISALQFSKYFLNTQEHQPNIHKILTVTQVIAAFGIVLRLFGVHELVLHLSFLGLLLLILLPVIGVISYRKGERAAKWYIAAWLLYGFGILISLLSAATPIFDWGMKPLLFTQLAGLLESFLLMMAVADKVAQINKQLIAVTNESQTDALTGLGNRRLLRQKLETLQAFPTGGRSSHWIMMLDIDNFKIINDTYGHDIGDQVLESVAKILKQSCRPEDIAVRFGGEEFVLILQAADLRVITHIANRIKDSVEYGRFTFDDDEVKHTLSIGIAKLNLNKPDSASETIKQADSALYFAKNNGRNAIALYDHNGSMLI